MAISVSAPSALDDSGLVVDCALACDRGERDAHFAIRRRVFVEAQRIFEHDDRDEHDRAAATLHVIGRAGDEVVGAVRLYPLDADGLWKGDRLAVLPGERALHLGARLVRFAVRTAGDHGGRLMVARVQVPNVSFFERLGWHRDGDPGPMLGVTHQPMAIELAPSGLSRRPDR